jgi:hypothetical protein
MVSEYIGNSKKVYDNLENTLKNEWIKQDKISANENNIKSLIAPFANLSYFVGNDGKFLYNDTGLDYDAILAQNPILKRSNNNETKNYIKYLFMQTNSAFRKLDILIDGANYSRFHYRFGEKGRIKYTLSKNTKDLTQLENISGLKPFFEGNYFNNSLSLLETITKNSGECAIIKEKIKSRGNYILPFLKLSQESAEKKGILGHDINRELDKKIAKYFSAIDEIDAEECKANGSLGKNRITPHIINYLVTIIGEKNIDEKYLSPSIINWIKEQEKKKN